MLLDHDVLARDAVLQPEKEAYVTMAGWHDNPGRPDLVDCVADEYERRGPRRRPPATANYA